MALNNLSVLVIDIGGLFTESAVRFARDVKKVWYFAEWREAFAGITRAKIGDGLDGVERVGAYEEYLNKADMIFIPDTMCSGLTEFLKERGFMVAGAGAAEKLELNRWYGRNKQRENGLPVQETHKIIGVTALRKFLQENKKYYVKIDCYRDTLESFKHTDYKSSEQEIDDLAFKLGPYKEEFPFICEELLDGKEPGIDGITFDGELLYPCQVGYEEKGVGIIERTFNTPEELPVALRMIDEGLAPEFKKMETRFFYSAEIKIDKDKVPYLIDPTIRHAAPGTSAIQTEAIENYTDVCYGLACGEKVNPIIKYKYAGAVCGESSIASKRWLNVSFPKDMRRWVKFRTAVKKHGEYYACPGFPSICSVIALGNTIDEVANKIKERAEEVKATGLYFDTKGLDDIKNNINEGKKFGINF